MAILKIGHDTSRRAEQGISLREALMRTNYKNLRPSFGPSDLLPIIQDNPSLVEEWIAYSDDKRTDGGWYITEEGQIGKVGESKRLLSFESLHEAVAEYVIRELDFWASMDSHSN
jgi:hypothetical protein